MTNWSLALTIDTMCRTWQEQAVCRGRTEVMYDEDNEPLAQAICRGCGVWAPCLVTAILRGEVFGVWGGLNGWHRRMPKETYRLLTDGIDEPVTQSEAEAMLARIADTRWYRKRVHRG